MSEKRENDAPRSQKGEKWGKALSMIAKYGFPAVLILYVTVSFIYAWNIDQSRPGSYTWADQREYLIAAQAIVNGTPLNLHFSVGYPLLAVIPLVIGLANPFMAVTYVLLLASLLFCYYAARNLVGSFWALCFGALLFYWDFQMRSFNFSMELFAVPWNNQVLFFALAYAFWMLSRLPLKNVSLWDSVAFGAVAGLTVIARQEAVLFVVPLLFTWIFLTKAPKKTIALTIAAFLVLLVPQVVAKQFENKDADRTYGSALSEYFHPGVLKRNIWEVMIDSRHYGNPQPPIYVTNEHRDVYKLGGPDPRRESVLQTSWWLWIAPVGIALLLFSRKVGIGVKVFIGVGLMVLLFYLSGANMSSHKLQFHCIRYITPSFIVLNFAVIWALKTGFEKVGATRLASRNQRS
ncbi:MAG TPA: hypothetical protein PK096_01250 [Candidatus Saccharibacteria bacterium]|nr:hypothetical protein [Candidatus Saccharibacteria bacterium]HRK93975.1 hypothetical protein [Candidatus Saccharibacteria bacterium]